MNDENTSISFLCGPAKFEQPRYTLARNPDGTASLSNDLMSLTGEYSDLLAGAKGAGIKIELVFQKLNFGNLD